MTAEEMVRTMKPAFEAVISRKLNITHKEFSGSVVGEHTFGLINERQVGQGGKTSCERWKGKRFNGDLLRFATPVVMRVAGWLARCRVRSRQRGAAMALGHASSTCMRPSWMRLSEVLMVRTWDKKRQEREVTKERCSTSSWKCRRTTRRW